MEVKEYEPRMIGMRLKSGMADVGMTADELANRIGVSRYTVTEWLMGRRSPKLIDAAKICDVLGKPLDWLARRDEPSAA